MLYFRKNILDVLYWDGFSGSQIALMPKKWFPVSGQELATIVKRNHCSLPFPSSTNFVHPHPVLNISSLSNKNNKISHLFEHLLCASIALCSSHDLFNLVAKVL